MLVFLFCFHFPFFLWASVYGNKQNRVVISLLFFVLLFSSCYFQFYLFIFIHLTFAFFKSNTNTLCAYILHWTNIRSVSNVALIEFCWTKYAICINRLDIIHRFHWKCLILYISFVAGTISDAIALCNTRCLDVV